MERKTISEIYGLWRDMKYSLVKESTIATYVTNAEKHILPVLGDRTSVTESDVQTFVVEKLDSGLSQRTVRDILLVLKMINAYGARNGWIDPADWNIKFPADGHKAEFQVLTLSQQRRLMSFLETHFSFRNLGLYICLCTGMRIGEICALKWGDISLPEKFIRVRRTIERVYVMGGGKKHTKLIIGTPKSASSMRDIPIGSNLLRVLRPIYGLVSATDFVLTNSDKPLEPRMYRHYYKRFMDKLGMPDMKFHGLRHTFATRCIESNCDYKTVSSILGHSSVSTTLNLYVHPDMGQKRKCIDRMLKSVK